MWLSILALGLVGVGYRLTEGYPEISRSRLALSAVTTVSGFALLFCSVLGTFGPA